jgi:inner membrane protein
MNVITHFLASWIGADLLECDARDTALVTWAGVSPDVDGLGVVVDLGNRLLGRPETFYYGQWHHVLLHGLPGAVLASAAVAPFAHRRLRTAALAFTAVHLHLACDLVGSRGPTPDDIWPVAYLSPFSSALTLAWPGQWALNAWPNIAFTLAMLAFVFVRAVKVGRSPVGVFSEKGNAAFVETVRRRWESLGSP